MELSAEALKEIGQMAGQNKQTEIVSVPHKASGQELIYMITRNDRGGMQSVDLTNALSKLDLNPARLTGTATHLTLESLIDHSKRFANQSSALFADIRPDQLSLRSVLNYHDALNNVIDGNGEEVEPIPTPQPQHGDHGGIYRFPLSEPWEIWNKASTSPMTMEEFSYFLEDHITDVMMLPAFLTGNGNADELSDADKALVELVAKLEGKPCGPEKLMTLAKGLQINEAGKTKTTFNRNTGEQQLVFVEEHTDEHGQTLSVPNMFLISIPVFKNSASYRIPVRLRYRKSGGAIYWIIALHRPDRMLEHAFNEACDKAMRETGLPLFFGQPE